MEQTLKLYKLCFLQHALPNGGCELTWCGCAGRHRLEVEALQSAHEATQEELVQRVAYLQVPHSPLPTLHSHLHYVYIFCLWAAYRFWLQLFTQLVS